MKLIRVQLRNFRSIREADIRISPFSLIIGPNGAGKSGFLQFFPTVLNFASKVVPEVSPGKAGHPFQPSDAWRRHLNHPDEEGWFSLEWEEAPGKTATFGGSHRGIHQAAAYPWEPGSVTIYAFDAKRIARQDGKAEHGRIGADGRGLNHVLAALGKEPEPTLFRAIETHLQMCVPEIEGLDIVGMDSSHPAIHVRERGLHEPVPAALLSEGTLIILGMLTLLLQKDPPRVILIEDVDRGMHPRLFERLAEVLETLALKRGVTLLASTHNPYLVDCFMERQEAVIVVEKNEGVTTLANLDERMESYAYDEETAGEMPLGSLWFSGLVGGVPETWRRKR